MRTALISDIHGNYDGLLAVLNDSKRRQCDRIVCLGDLVDGGPSSVEVVRLVQKLGIPTAQGNHDEYPNTPLPLEIEDWLRELPEAIVGDIPIPLVFGQRCLEQVSAASYPIPYDTEFQFDADDRYSICVGAVGYSRDGYHWLRYAIYDDVQDTVIFHAPEGPILVF